MKTKKNTRQHLIKSLIFSLSIIIISICSSCFAQDPILTAESNLAFSEEILSIDVLNPSGIQLKTGFSDAALNLVYQHEKKEFELGIVSQKFNELLPYGMTVELKTTPQSGSAGISFSKKF